jgi:hypothetical protein
MAEARLPEEALRRPWHGASDSVEHPGVAAIRLQRAEVEAMLEFRRAIDGSEHQARAWRRLVALRERRLALMADGAPPRLPPLPAAPLAGLSAWQKLRRRFGLSQG